MNFLELAKERYSCRSFAEKEVEMEKIEKNTRSSKISTNSSKLSTTKDTNIKRQRKVIKIKWMYKNGMECSTNNDNLLW